MVNRQAVSGFIQVYRRDLILFGVFVFILLFPVIIQRLSLDVGSFPEAWDLHLREPMDAFQTWAIRNQLTHPMFTLFFDPISNAIDWGIIVLETFLLWLPWPVVIIATFLMGYRAGGLGVALLSAGALMFMGIIDLWDEGMQTLALMGVSVFIALAIGVPLGILAARYDKFETGLRPILDAMQTMPAFVYLIPVVLFFGIARVPSVVATVIYALPPGIRLTNLGIRRVSPAAVEAARAFGSTPRQILFKVQLPLAMPTIITGVNQTIMMAFGIVVIAALIGAGGLGREVLIALQQQKVGQGLMAGLTIVFMSIVLDRISHGFSEIDTSHTGQQAKGFHLLPNSWDRFAVVRGFERGLNIVLDGFYRLSEAIARGLAAITNIVAALFGRKESNEAIRAFFHQNAFLSGSLFLIAGLLLFHAFVFSFGQQFPESWQVEFDQPVDTAIDWMRDNLYQIGDLPIGTGPLTEFLIIYMLNPIRSLLTDWLPWPLVIATVTLIAYAVGGWRIALFSAIGMFCLGLLGLWEQSMNTLSQVIVAVIITVVIAIPLGILASRSDKFEAFLRPILDTLQTIPFFVYLIPVIILFGVGRIPGIMASVLYALPPGIRLTNLGIRQVSPYILEAANAFGSTPRQTLFKVQIPLAMPSIALGVNQMIMMVLAMVVVGGLVGGQGLGLLAVKGLANPLKDFGRGIEAGIAIVIMAMIMDRITQAWAKKREVASQGH